MSIYVMSLVWRNFNRGGSEKLAMLALADWCDDNGENLWPSVAAVGEKINVSEKQARRYIHKFIEEGYLRVVGNEFGGLAGSTRHYEINLNKLQQSSKNTENKPKKDTPPTSVTPPTEGQTRLPPMGAKPLSTNRYKKEDSAKPSFDFDAGKFINLPSNRIEQWAEAYPAINVGIEIKKAAAWLAANPANRKSDYVRFLNGWLSRAQDRAPRVSDKVVSINAYPRNRHEIRANTASDMLGMFYNEQNLGESNERVERVVEHIPD